jgi:hypothetical protein
MIIGAILTAALYAVSIFCVYKCGFRVGQETELKLILDYHRAVDDPQRYSPSLMRFIATIRRLEHRR